MWLEILGYFCAVLVGISLGVLGSGGSIFTVPIMVYLLQVKPVEATGYSLFVVGLTSAIGCITYLRKKLVDLKTAFLFGGPSVIAVYLTRRLLMPLVPDPVISLSSLVISKDLLILLLFAVLMIIVAVNMIHSGEDQWKELEGRHRLAIIWLPCIGILSGMLTGIFGVGGGFILIPALVLFARIPIRQSVGTSLLIIALNSFSGFTGELLEKHESMDYRLLLLFSLLSISGIFIGLRLSLALKPNLLSKTFGWFVLVMAAAILVKELWLPG